MNKTAELRGLCTVCGAIGSCRLCSDGASAFMSRKCVAVLRCDQFELRSGCTLPSGLDDRMQDAETVPEDGDTGSPQLMGLCCNCANRFTCTYPKSEGGIWHCEEYL